MALNLSPRAHALANKQFKYMSLFEKYAVELRKDVTKGMEAYDRVVRDWECLLKPGEKPSRPEQDPSTSQKLMEDICSMVPKSLDDCVKVMCAAHAMTNSIVLHDMRNLTEHERGQVNLIDVFHSQQSLAPSDPKSILASLPFRPPPKMGKQHSSKHTPLALPGQRFSLQFLNDTVTYEVCGVYSDGKNAFRYKVKYEGEGEDEFEEEIEQEDMFDMLESSQLLDE